MEWTKEAILELRKSMNVTQKAFAESLGVTNVYVNYLEKGMKRPSKTVCIVLDCLRNKITLKEGKDNG